MRKIITFSLLASLLLNSCRTKMLDTASTSFRGIPVDMIFVQGGTFKMGAEGTRGSADEYPQHKVTLGDFYIAKYEVTQRLYETVMGNNPSANQGCPECPVESVSCANIDSFIIRLNKMTGKQYRLPTEAEWEYAAKGGRKSRGYQYPGSDTLAVVGWCEDAKATKTKGGKRPNELGIYDMAGNVCEFCSDWYDAAYYKTSPKENPQGPPTGKQRVKRGGCWYADECRNTDRGWSTPTNTLSYNGFRLVMSKSDK